MAMASNDPAWPSLMYDLAERVGPGVEYFFIAFHLLGLLASRALLVGVVMDRCARLQFTEKFTVLSAKQQIWVAGKLGSDAATPPVSELGVGAAAEGSVGSAMDVATQSHSARPKWRRVAWYAHGAPGSVIHILALTPCRCVMQSDSRLSVV